MENAEGTVQASGWTPDPNNLLDTIDWGGVRVDTHGLVTESGQQIIRFYFAQAGEVFGGGEGLALGWPDWAKAGVYEALTQYESIINVKFIEVNDPNFADFYLATASFGPGSPTLGIMNPPGEEMAGLAAFNVDLPVWNETNFGPGGYSLVTILHELGHGLGLAHPHDDGGGSSRMHGVSQQGDLGDFGLNEGVYTVMSYNDGWPVGPNGPSGDFAYGFNSGLAALETALLQQKYGANSHFNGGDNVYVLPSADQLGTAYAAIWDTGGTDWIMAGDDKPVSIDLRAATLQYGFGGGGFVSYATGVHGGFTIDNGVTIENAAGGAGNDDLIGNAGANVLRGGAGNDRMDGLEGIDTASYADAAKAVTVRLAVTIAQNTGGGGVDLLRNIENLAGSDFNDSLTGDGGANGLAGGAGDDRLDGGAGNDNLDGGAGADVLIGGLGDDALSDTDSGADSFYGLAGNDVLSVVHAASLSKVVLDGGEGDDILRLDAPGGMTYGIGGAGNDRFELSAQATVTGGTGTDLFYLAADYDSAHFVTVADFTTGAGGDRFSLTDYLTANLTGWNPASNPFTGGFLHLAAQGANVMLQVDFDGGSDGFTTLFLIQHASLAAFTTFNLGYDPRGAPTEQAGTPGADVLNGTAGPDLIQGLGGDDTLKGLAGDDSLDGGAGKDLLYGLAGNDHLTGGLGDDRLDAGAGDDVLSGGEGADTLIGGQGLDRITGGAGADLFVFSSAGDSSLGAADLILDFNAAGGDRISVAGIDANTVLAGDQAFVFAAAFTHVAGQAVRSFDAVHAVTTVAFDTNGDGVADFGFQIAGDQTGSAAGWLL